MRGTRDRETVGLEQRQLADSGLFRMAIENTKESTEALRKFQIASLE